MSDFGCWMSDVGCRISDFGFQMLKIKILALPTALSLKLFLLTNSNFHYSLFKLRLIALRHFALRHFAFRHFAFRLSLNYISSLRVISCSTTKNNFWGDAVRQGRISKLPPIAI